MVKILFICHGNICRSPMAEFVLKSMVKDQNLCSNFQIDSAATSTEEIGNDIYPPAKACLKRHEIEYGNHHAKQITKKDIDYYDYIIAMEKYNIKNLQRMLGTSCKYSLLLDYTEEYDGNIADPWYSGDYETAFNQIEAGCRGLLSKISEKLQAGF